MHPQALYFNGPAAVVTSVCSQLVAKFATAIALLFILFTCSLTVEYFESRCTLQRIREVVTIETFKPAFLLVLTVLAHLLKA